MKIIYKQTRYYTSSSSSSSSMIGALRNKSLVYLVYDVGVSRESVEDLTQRSDVKKSVKNNAFRYFSSVCG